MTVSVKCIPSCSACKNYTYCTFCNMGYLHQPDQTCSSDTNCPPRTILNGETLVCQKCPYDCFTCFSDSTCESCSNSDNRQLDLTTRRCIPISHYFDNKQTVCLACPANCLICKSLALCTVCLSGAFMSTIDHLCYLICPLRQFSNPQTSTCQSCPYDC